MNRIVILLRPLWRFGLLLLMAPSVSRMLLVGWQRDRVLDAQMLGNVLIQGLRFDLVLLGFFLLWPVDAALPTLHRQIATQSADKPKNIVIILEESLGAEYVGSLDGLPLTPRLDALKEQGLWFENLYATGTRSVRGIEAVVTGFTPTPARSIVKFGGSQRGFFSLPQLLRAAGY